MLPSVIQNSCILTPNTSLQSCQCILTGCCDYAQHDAVVLQHDMVVSRHDVVVSRHDAVVLQHDVVVLQHDVVVLQHDVVVSRHDLAALLLQRPSAPVNVPSRD